MPRSESVHPLVLLLLVLPPHPGIQLFRPGGGDEGRKEGNRSGVFRGLIGRRICRSLPSMPRCPGTQAICALLSVFLRWLAVRGTGLDICSVSHRTVVQESVTTRIGPSVASIAYSTALSSASDAARPLWSGLSFGSPKWFPP